MQTYGAGAPYRVEHGRGVAFILSQTPASSADDLAWSGCHDGEIEHLTGGGTLELYASAYAYGDVESLDLATAGVCLAPYFGEPPGLFHERLAVTFETRWWHGEVEAEDCGEVFTFSPEEYFSAPPAP